MFSIDVKAKHVGLSLLPEDTGKADILPESLALPLRLTGEEKVKYDQKKATRKRNMPESKQVCICMGFHWVIQFPSTSQS